MNFEINVDMKDKDKKTGDKWVGGYIVISKYFTKLFT